MCLCVYVICEAIAALREQVFVRVCARACERVCVSVCVWDM